MLWEINHRTGIVSAHRALARVRSVCGDFAVAVPAHRAVGPFHADDRLAFLAYDADDGAGSAVGVGDGGADPALRT